MIPFRKTLALAVVLVASNAVAASEEAQRKAAESFRQAQAAFARREYSAAAAAFEQAASFAPHPSPLLDASEAWVLAGEPVRAAEDCDRVMAMSDAEPKFKDEAQRCLDGVAPKIATLDFEGPRTAAVRLDGGGDTVVPARRRVSPGHHALVVVDLASGATRSFELDLAAGEKRAIDVSRPPWSGAAAEPPSRAPSAPAPTEPVRAVSRSETPSGGVPTGTWIAFGVAATGAAVGGVFGAMTMSAKSTFDGAPTRENADAFHRDKAVTNVAFAVAGVAAVVGAGIWIAAPASSSAAVGVASRPGGGTLSLATRF